MTANEIFEMADALDIPDPMITEGQYSFPAVEALCLLCARFQLGADLYLFTILYDRSQSSLSELINELVEFLDERWEHLLACDSDHLLHPSKLAQYAAAIFEKGSPLPHIIAFLDCTIHRICHPTWYQRMAYNGHKKFHAMKFQALMLPNGIIGHLYGPFEGRRHDSILLTECGLLERLAEFAYPENPSEDLPIEEQTYQLYGDPAYGVGPHIISPFSGAGQRTPEQMEWNASMSALHIEVEHGFAVVVNTWPFLNVGWKMRLYSSPVGRYYRVGVLLTNRLNCLHPGQVSTYFDCRPPTLREYLHD